MAAPAFGSLGTHLAGAATSPGSVAVPSGMAANEVAFVVLEVEDWNAVVTPPSGFTEVTNSPVTVGNMSLHLFWKRATGADSGTYDFTFTGSLTWRHGIAMRISGVNTSGVPFDVVTKGAGQSGTSGDALSMTTTVADTLLIHVGSNLNNRTYTPPTGFTSRFVDAAGDGGLGISTNPQASAGATGTVQNTWSNTGTNASWMGALKPAAAAAANTGNFFRLF
jgi:hypothetical protein